jgi:hypothetical protein
MKVGNDIAVKVHTYTEDTLYDIKEDIFTLYNNNDLFTNVSKTGVFTGIKFDINDKVTIECYGDGRKLPHYYYKNFIYLENIKSNLKEPVAVVKFKPRNKQKNINEFTPHFLIMGE